MAAFENTQKITSISFQVKTRHYCPLGGQRYTNQFDVQFKPADLIPDYVEVQRKIDLEIDSQPLIVEDAVKKMFELIDQYKPLSLSVTAYSDDAIHFPVTVNKTKGE